MDLVHLYGPPASGKLTVAEELAARTGYGLFHNHLSIDCVKPVFEFGTDPFWRVVRAIRETTLLEAAREGRDVICTGVYSRDDGAAVLRRFDLVERHGGRVCPVQLYCPIDTLIERVDSAERRAIGKLTSRDGLAQTLAEHDLFDAIPGRESLRIDTSRCAPAEAAERVITHYRLTSGTHKSS